MAIYDDRLEISSSGELHFGLTPDKLLEGHECQPWNPLIARAFFLRGIIEEWGRGTLPMARLAASAGLPPLRIQNSGGCVTVSFRYHRLTLSTRHKVVVDQTPQQCKFDFALWTTNRLRHAFYQEFGVRIRVDRAPHSATGDSRVARSGWPSIEAA